MATLPQLMSPAEDDSSEDSFDHVSDNFDGEYEELTGRATGDYVPGQKDEVAIREGDVVTITEQSLDGRCFMVVNMRTGDSGSVPVEFIDFKPEDMDSAEPGMQDSGTKRRSGVGIIRRNRVSKTRPKAFRQFRMGSNDEKDLAASLPANMLLEDNSDRTRGIESRSPPTSPARGPSQPLLSRSGRPASAGTTGGVPRSPPLLTVVGGESRPKSWNPGQSEPSHLQNTSPLEAAASGGERRFTRGVRAHTVNLLPDVPPELKLIEKHNIVSVCGAADKDGRPVIVFSACRLPPSYQISHQRLFEYLKFTLDRYVEQDYTLLYFHFGFSSTNKPSFSWLRQVYKELDRKYKKNLKKLYVVHPTNFIRIMMILFKPFISYKFGRKLTYINRLDELSPALYLEQIDIPDEVKQYDTSLNTAVRRVVQTDSRSVFHTPLPSGGETDTRQFGISLERLMARTGDPIPVVLRVCIGFLEENGMDVLGIFRRTPSNVMVNTIKKRFDSGEKVDFAEYGDPHLAAVVMKLFLRELPKPVMTLEAYQSILELRGKTDYFKLHRCTELISRLPETNYQVLKYLIAFLCKVTDHQEVNKMTPMNLAIVFGPNLIWSSDQAGGLTSLGEINTFTLLLINHFSEIFTK